MSLWSGFLLMICFSGPGGLMQILFSRADKPRPVSGRGLIMT